MGRGWEAAWLGDGLVGPGKGPSGRGEVTAGKEREGSLRSTVPDRPRAGGPRETAAVSSRLPSEKVEHRGAQGRRPAGVRPTQVLPQLASPSVLAPGPPCPVRTPSWMGVIQSADVGRTVGQELGTLGLLQKGITPRGQLASHGEIPVCQGACWADSALRLGSQSRVSVGRATALWRGAGTA